MSALDFRVDHAALYGAMQAGDYEEVFALVGAAIADVLVQHARAEEDARGEADAVSEAYEHAAALASGALCNCPGVFHHVENHNG